MKPPYLLRPTLVECLVLGLGFMLGLCLWILGLLGAAILALLIDPSGITSGIALVIYIGLSIGLLLYILEND